MSISVRDLFERLRYSFSGKKSGSAADGAPSVRYTPQLLFDSTRTEVVGVNDRADLTKVVIPGHVRKIAQRAFRNNNSIEEVYISDGVREIEKYAFAFCKNLKRVRLPEGLETLPYGCFYASRQLSEASLPASLKIISGDAFAKTAIKQAELPDSVIAIHDGAFGDCPITSVRFGSGLRRIGSKAFGSCHKLTSLELPKGLRQIDPSAFTDCTGLRSVSLPDSLENIGDRIFSGCNMLKELRLPLTAGEVFGKLNISMLRSLETLTLGHQSLDMRGIMPHIDPRNQSAFLSMAAAAILGKSGVIEKYGYYVGADLVFRTYIFLVLGGCKPAADMLKNADKSVLSDRMRGSSARLTERLIDMYGENISRECIDDLIDIAANMETHESYLLLLQYKRGRFGFDGDENMDGSLVGNRFEL